MSVTPATASSSSDTPVSHARAFAHALFPTQREGAARWGVLIYQWVQLENTRVPLSHLGPLLEQLLTQRIDLCVDAHHLYLFGTTRRRRWALSKQGFFTPREWVHIHAMCDPAPAAAHFDCITNKMLENSLELSQYRYNHELEAAWDREAFVRACCEWMVCDVHRHMGDLYALYFSAMILDWMRASGHRALERWWMRNDWWSSSGRDKHSSTT